MVVPELDEYGNEMKRSKRSGKGCAEYEQYGEGEEDMVVSPQTRDTYIE